MKTTEIKAQKPKYLQIYLQYKYFYIWYVSTANL